MKKQTILFLICFILQLTVKAQNPSDGCGSPPTLPVNASCSPTSFTLPGSYTNGALNTNSSCATAGNNRDDGWYQFTATSTTTNIDVSINTNGAVVTVWTSCSSGGGTEIACQLIAAGSSATLNFSTTVGNTYYIQIWRRQGNGNASLSGTICVYSGGGGGSCPTDANIASIPFSATGQTTCGSGDDFSSTDACGSSYMNGDDYVYTYTPSTNECISISLSNTGSWVGVFVTDACPSSPGANCIASSTSSTGNPSICQANLTAGTTYYITISTFPSPQCTSFDINITNCSCSPPSNDDCSGATPVTVGAYNGGCTTAVSGTVECATQSSQSTSACSGTEDDDVWFSFVAPASGTVNIDLLNITGSTTDLYHSVWSGSCPSLSLVTGSCSDPNSSSISGLTPGQTYYVRVYTYTSTSCQNTTFDICIEDGACPSPPSNDECSGATPVTVNTSGCTSTANGAVNCATQTTSPANSSSCFGTADDDVWFSFTAPATGAVSINLQNISGSTTDLYHSVWSGTCPSLTLVSGTCSDPNSQQVTSLTPGQTYYLRVYTYTSTSGQTTTFDVCISEIDACGSNGTNDFCEDAATLSPGGSFLSNTTSAYTVDAPGNLNSEFCGSIDNNSWYQFTATSTTETFNFNTVANCTYSDGIQAEVYSVTTDANGCCSNFTSMSNCWNPATQTSGTVTATGLTVGQTYYLMVDGYAGDQCDFEVLGWSSTPVLPVELISFTGKPIAEGNFLKWVTATEINNKAFFVERSVDGHLFETIGRVEGNGNSNVINNYSYIDENVAPTSTFYYRLKQMDFDGKISYSDVIVINRNDAIIDVYPNPSDDNLYLNLQNIDEQNITIKIYDVVGKEIYSSTGNISSNSQTINLSNEINLSKGIYFIAVYNNQNEKIFFEQIIRK